MYQTMQKTRADSLSKSRISKLCDQANNFWWITQSSQDENETFTGILFTFNNTLKGSTVSLDLHQDRSCRYNVSTKRRRSREGFLDNILKPCIVEQQLSQHLLQNLHSISEVGEVGQHVIIDLLDSSSPVGGELSHQRLNQTLIHGWLLSS